MDVRGALIPYHFGHRWDIIPRREGQWDILDVPRIADRLSLVNVLKPSLVVSGDCMAAIPAHRNGLGMVWMDSHGDFNTLLTTETGNIGGMPLAMMCGLGDQRLMCHNDINPLGGCGSPVLHIGGSSFDDGERARMLNHGVTVINFLAMAPRHKVHLHIDTDVISAKDLPSSIHPPKDGEGMPLDTYLMQLDILLPQVEVLSIKTYDPRLDACGKGEAIVLETIRRFYATR